MPACGSPHSEVVAAPPSTTYTVWAALPSTTYPAHVCPGDELLLASPLAREPHAGSGALLDRLSPGAEGLPRHNVATADSSAANAHQSSSAATPDTAAPDALQLAEKLHATSMRGNRGAANAAPGGGPPEAHQPAGAVLGSHKAGSHTESSQSQGAADARQPDALGTAQHPLVDLDPAPAVGYPTSEPIAHASQQAAASLPAQPPQQQVSQQPAVQPAASAEQDPPSQRRW